MSKTTILSAAAVIGLMAGSGSFAQESKIVLGPTLLQECNNAAAAAQRTGHASNIDLQTCSDAITRAWTTAGEIAGAYVHRGTLHLVRGESREALRDFTLAINEDSALAEAYNDRGVALSKLNRQADAIRDFSQALALRPENADQVVFNRAMAYEDAGDLKSAYQDYRMAAELNPGWDLPARQLARFSVSR
jgi:tetratricopeptide (TPR) repeat protein